MYRTLLISLLLMCFAAVPSVRAEWLWDDREDVRNEFQKLITANLSKECSPRKVTDVFGYQSAYRAGERSIAYEMVLHLDKPCFETLVRKLKGLKQANQLKLRAKVPDRFADIYKADGGPTVVFYFPATEGDLHDIERLEHGLTIPEEHRVPQTARTEVRPRSVKVEAPKGAPAAPATPESRHAQTDARLMELAVTSELRKHPWRSIGDAEAPGRGPIGYTKGMALAYADVYRRWKHLFPDRYVAAMAKKPSAENPRDALWALRDIFAQRGMQVEKGGLDTVRALYVLLYELGLRESDGQYYEGLDTGRWKDRNELRNPHPETTEAGLFQSSWDAADGRPLMQGLFAEYAKGKGPCYADVFKEGLRPHPLLNVGKGPGADFQQLTKVCPGFAVEFAALALRDQGAENYHFVKLRRLEISPKAEQFFKKIETIVDEEN
jgi:hypothetical protein